MANLRHFLKFVSMGKYDRRRKINPSPVVFNSEENDEVKEDGSRILPILALNEVFIGESLSSRVSYLELQVSISNANIRTSKFALDATHFT